MSNGEIVSSIRKAWKALEIGDVENVLSHYSADATLCWGPFTFKGKKEIGEWARELKRMFPTLSIIETGINVEENKATQEFIMGVTLNNGFRGALNASGKYEYKDMKIIRAEITLSYGVGIIQKKDIELHLTKYHYNLLKKQKKL